jgi:Ca2+-binding RTX toxin-like protein
MSYRERSSRRTRRFLPRLEVLESRWLPSTLFYETRGDDGPNNLVLNIESNKLTLRDNGEVGDQVVLDNVDGVVIIGADGEADTLTIDYGPGFFATTISFSGGAGDGDAIAVAADMDFTLTDVSLNTSQGSPVALDGVEQAFLTGGAGNNAIDAQGFSGSTTLDGGAGNDTLIGGAGVDAMLGGDDDDRLVSLTGGDDWAYGGFGNDYYYLDPGSTTTAVDDGGNDVIDLSALAGGVDATLGGDFGNIFEQANPGSTIAILGSIETLLATNWDDILLAANTSLPTLEQTLVGGAGNDVFIDGSLADLLNFFGGAAPGFGLLGGGNDVYRLDPGSTITVTDDGGNDTIDLGSSDSGSANVILDDTGGSVTVPGGNAVLIGILEQVVGTVFDDLIQGNSFDNVLDGGAGEDEIIGGGGVDTIIGGAGDDMLNGGDASTRYVVVPGSTDTIVDSGGVDTLDFSGALRGITLNLSSNGNQVIDAAGNKINLSGTFENVIGTPFNDTINGNAANNLLVGGGGDDQLSGHQGRDILIGGAGADRLIGGADEDILIGGTTAFDSILTALLAIQAEWSSSRSYATRVANLRGPGTEPRLNGDFFLKASGAGQTVFNDAAVDTLTGSQQSDWFFLFAGDVQTDQNQNEFVN